MGKNTDVSALPFQRLTLESTVGDAFPRNHDSSCVSLQAMLLATSTRESAMCLVEVAGDGGLSLICAVWKKVESVQHGISYGRAATMYRPLVATAVSILASVAPCLAQGGTNMLQTQMQTKIVVYTVYATKGLVVSTSSNGYPFDTPQSHVTSSAHESEVTAKSNDNEASCKPTPIAREPSEAAEGRPSTSATSTAHAASYMITVDKWRARMGLKPLVNDARLESNAADTVLSGNGQMIHKLNPGSFGQVLAPGNGDDFEHVFVGGWLCEIPTLPGLQNVCSTQSDGWAYNGQTGHAEILISDNYSKIGCALHAGVWCCDLA